MQTKQSKSNEQAFNKAIQVFMKRYPLTVVGLFQFIDGKIDASQDIKKMIKTKIQRYYKLGATFDNRIDDLVMFFHLISAAQKGVDILNKDLKQFQNHYLLKFVSSKSAESKGNKGNKQQYTKAQSKKVEIIDFKVQQKKNKEDIIKVQKFKQKNNEKEKEIISNKDQIVNKAKTPIQNTSNNKKSQPKKEVLLGTIQQNLNDSQSSQVNYPSIKTQQYLLNHPSIEMMNLQQTNYVQITGYDKFGQNYFNPIIKFHIVYGIYSVYRRYSQFQNLMNYLNIEYQGNILPQMPPKEGIKSNLAYFRGIDQAFLNQRQLKLQQMLNFLLNSKVIKHDTILQKFLKQQQFQIPSNTDNSTLSYLKSLTTIALSAKQLKIYGTAYYNYLKQFKKQQINTQVVTKYKEIQNILNICLNLDNYRNCINNNYQQRRQLFKQLKVDKDDRNLVITKFDKLSASSASQIRNLSKQFNKYLDLKSQQSWLNYLIIEKQNQEDQNIELKQNKEDIVKRIGSMQKNLIVSIEDIKNQKLNYLKEIQEKIIEWRKAIHP